MEADLQKHCNGIDYRDYLTGRREHGRPVLSFRRLAVLVRHLPPESACASLEFDGFALRSVTDALLADLFRAMTGRQHPLAETPKDREARLAAVAAEKAKEAEQIDKVAEAKARIAQRKADIAAGQIT